MLTLILTTLLGGLAGIVVFIYYFSQGQFDDLEDAKYQMFRQESGERMGDEKR